MGTVILARQTDGGVDQAVGPGTPLPVTATPSAAAGAGTVPVTSTAAESGRVVSATAANLYSWAAQNLTGVPGWAVVLNAASIPADGAIVPLEIVYLPAYGRAGRDYEVPLRFGTGVVVVVTSAATGFTKTTSGGLTAFIQGVVK